MADEKDPTTEVKETDIVFDCPHCGKSLAIDYRGAGLTIPCTDCGKSVQVPIPDGMQLDDLDSSEEERAGLLIHLREALSASQTHVRRLEGEVEELKAQRDRLERANLQSRHKLEQVSREIVVIRKAMEQITDALASVTSAVRGEAV